jgi:large subunit ribosomal protein L24
MAKIKKGDVVVVIAGRDRGKQGRVLEVLVEREQLIVEGIQRVQRHVKPGTRKASMEGGIITIEAPIHTSNVMLVDPQTKKGTRVGYRMNEVERDGVKRTVRVRIAKRSGKDV